MSRCADCGPTLRSPIRGVWHKIFVDHNDVPLSFRDAQTQQISVKGVLRLQPRVPNVNLYNKAYEYVFLGGYLCLPVFLHLRHTTAALLVSPLAFSCLFSPCVHVPSTEKIFRTYRRVIEATQGASKTLLPSQVLLPLHHVFSPCCSHILSHPCCFDPIQIFHPKQFVTKN